MVDKEERALDAARGIADPATIEMVPRPHDVYQLQGHQPDVATLAYSLADAQERIARILGVEKLPASAKVVRLG